MMIPFAVYDSSVCYVYKDGMDKRLLPLIIPGLFGNVSIIFFLRQNLTSVPDTLVEAAKLTAADIFKTMVKIMIPMARPSIITVILFQFLSFWNEYIIAFTLMDETVLWQ